MLQSVVIYSVHNRKRTAMKFMKQVNTRFTDTDCVWVIRATAKDARHMIWYVQKFDWVAAFRSGKTTGIFCSTPCSALQFQCKDNALAAVPHLEGTHPEFKFEIKLMQLTAEFEN